MPAHLACDAHDEPPMPHLTYMKIACVTLVKEEVKNSEEQHSD